MLQNHDLVINSFYPKNKCICTDINGAVESCDADTIVAKLNKKSNGTKRLNILCN